MTAPMITQAPAPGDWSKRAACRGRARRDDDPWDTPDTRWYAPPEAKRLCDVCPVHAECLKWALDHPYETGVWGGLTKKQRDYLRRRPRVRSSCPDCGDPMVASVEDDDFQICLACGLAWRVRRRVTEALSHSETV